MSVNAVRQFFWFRLIGSPGGRPGHRHVGGPSQPRRRRIAKPSAQSPRALSWSKCVW